MKQLFLIAIIFFYSLSTHSQSNKLAANDIRKVLLYDSSGGLGSHIATQYEITFSKGDASLYIVYQDYQPRLAARLSTDFDLKKTSRRKLIKQIPISSIDSLLKYISQPPNIIDLNLFGIDKNWINANYLRVAESFYPAERLFSQVEKERAIELFKNPENYKKTIIDQDHWWDYNPSCSIILITKDLDSIKIVTDGQGPYLYPWHLKNETNKCFYDPRISLWFANLLPIENFSNKKNLKGENFINDLTSRMFRNEFKKEFKDAGNSYYIREKQIDIESLIELKNTYGITSIINQQNSICIELGYDSSFYFPYLYIRDISFLQNKDSMRLLIDRIEKVKNDFINSSIIKQNFNLVINFYIQEYSDNYFKEKQIEDILSDLRFIKGNAERLTSLIYFAPITLYEKDSTTGMFKSSDWLMDKNGKLILWRYSNKVPFNLKSRKYKGRYRNNINMHIVMKEIP